MNENEREIQPTTRAEFDIDGNISEVKDIRDFEKSILNVWKQDKELNKFIPNELERREMIINNYELQQHIIYTEVIRDSIRLKIKAKIEELEEEIKKLHNDLHDLHGDVW